MRVIFASDVHHAFRQIDELLKKTEADLYLIAGDLVSRAFFRYQTAWRFMELQQILAGYRATDESEETLDQLAKRLIAEGRGSQLSSHAQDYLRLCRKAEIYLQKAYERLEEIFVRYPQKTIYTLPGNYDMDLRQTALRNRHLHLHCIELDCGRLAGYGGALVKTPGIPDHLQIPFREERRHEGVKSEALDFFQKARPDLLILHQPAYGRLDYLPGYGHVGSHGIRDYLDEAKVKLVLSGHHHDQWASAFADGTAFFNPSNFGRTVEVSRTRPGGFFLEVSLQKEGVNLATLRQLEKGHTYDVLDYKLSNGVIESLILDEKRYSRLGGKIPRAHHISPLRQFHRIKSFFLGYETAETQALINELRNIYRDLQKEGIEVAFDLLGSLSFGMAQENSDMDLVVYMRSKDCRLDDEDTCGIPRPLAAVFNALEERDLNVEVCDSLDLDRVRQAIQEKNLKDGQLQRFIFYRLVCRPVNLRAIKRVENLLLQREDFRREMEKGINISPDVEEAIRNYLRG